MKRIQRKRTKGWRLPPNTVCITRGTKWGNPLKIMPKKGTDFGHIYVQEFKDKKTWYRTNYYGYVTDVIWLFEKLLKGSQFGDKHLQVWSDYFSKLDLTQLIGKDLACFCKEGEPCHGDVLINFIQEKYE